MLAIVPRGASLWVGCFVVMVVHYYGAYLFPFSASLHPDDMLLPTYLSSRGALGALVRPPPVTVQFSSVQFGGQEVCKSLTRGQDGSCLRWVPAERGHASLSCRKES